jgi:hypothetical protein
MGQFSVSVNISRLLCRCAFNQCAQPVKLDPRQDCRFRDRNRIETTYQLGSSKIPAEAGMTTTGSCANSALLSRIYFP